MSRQRYVSRELTHFVGRKFRDEDSTVEAIWENQYILFREILLKGQLGINPSAAVAIALGGSAPLSSNTIYTPQMVCFCDIPVDDLQIHRSKYSRFGLAFSKRFLVK